MKEKRIKSNHFSKKKMAILGAISTMCIIVLLVVTLMDKKELQSKSIDPELARAMTYERFQDGDEIVDGTNGAVNFSAFFLRDVDDDGYADKIKGTAKEIGKEDTLFMEINIQSEGMLKDAKIRVEGKNFTLATSLIRDDQLKDNYISNDIHEICFNQMNSGTQKLLRGSINSKILNNIENYSKNDNKIIFTGTYVARDGTQKEIQKEVNLTVDWYGITKAKINDSIQSDDIQSAIKEKTFDINFTITTQETANQLVVSKNCVEGTMPDLNGYFPIDVTTTSITDEFQYDATTHKFTIVKNSNSHKNMYNINVQYDKVAYETIGKNAMSIEVPIMTYYEGYNNINFQNPYKSNEAITTIVKSYHTYPEDGNLEIGRVDMEMSKSISKDKPLRIYNGESAEEKEDYYNVEWTITTGKDVGANEKGIKLREEDYTVGANREKEPSDYFIKSNGGKVSMENITTNVGIQFTVGETLNWDDGWINVYDDETNNLITTLTSENWNQYYKFETPVKHIRIETSKLNPKTIFTVNCQKELDDEYITTHYTKEEFDDFKYIYSKVQGYADGVYIGSDSAHAVYTGPRSSVKVTCSEKTLSTQEIARNKRIYITTGGTGWLDGNFLIKLPEEIVTAKINNIYIGTDLVNISNYELVKKDNINFIKINTKNVKNNGINYTITIELDLAVNPITDSTEGKLELYASNTVSCEFDSNMEDKYDVNNNHNKDEKVAYNSTNISFTKPEGLITCQTISEYDNTGNTIMTPEIAEIKPNYASVDNEERKAKISVQVLNNCTEIVDEVKILGKIPFEGNTYAIREESLGSTFSTKMTNEGINIPENLKGKVKVYYSENPNPTKDLDNEQNKWKTQEEGEINWDEVKTYLIDFGETTMQTGNGYAFSYTVKIPKGTEINKVSYSHHGIYYTINFQEGKYPTQLEPSKIGLRIAEKYNLELTKYQIQKEKLVQGATYSVKEVTEDTASKEGKVATTNELGQLQIEGLYAGKTYEIEETRSTEDYEVNTDKIRYTTKVDDKGNFNVEKLQGTVKEDMSVIKEEGEDYKVTVKVEDEVKARLKIIKKEKDTDNKIGLVYYKITGEGFSEDGKIFSTDVKGEINLKGITINKEYTLQEMKATGYYLADPIKFKVVNNDGNYEVQITEENGQVKDKNITKDEEDCIPTANITIENEKKPTYDLEITKIKKITNVNTSTQPNEPTTPNTQDVEVLPEAMFKLYKDNKEIGNYITEADGKVTIKGLYQYVDGKDENAVYTLKEVAPPNGYSKIKDITFKVQEIDGKLKFITEDEIERTYTSESNVLKLQIEDSPVFKLIKKDGETSQTIAGVKFAFFKIENESESEPARNGKGEILGTKENINGTEYYTLTTDSKGEITADLPEGEYKAIEVQTPEKYEISNKPYYFSIGNQKEPKYILETLDSKIIDSNGSFNTNFQIINTSDNGYLINSNGTLIKYNNENKEQWRLNESIGETSSGNETDKNRITEINSGEYISCSKDTILKCDKDGKNVTKKTIDEGIEIFTITKTRDGGFVVGGVIKEELKGVLIKYDKELEQQQQWILENNGDDDIKYISLVKEIKDNEFIIVGGDEYWKSNKIAKYDSNQKIEWEKDVKELEEYNENRRINSILVASDGSILVGASANVWGDNLYIIKYNKEGEEQWRDEIQKCSQSTGTGVYSIIETNDGGYAIGVTVYGSTVLSNREMISGGGYIGIVIKYNINGEIQYTKEIEGSDSRTYMKSLIQTQDGDYIVGGNNNQTINLDDGQKLNKGTFLIRLKTKSVGGVLVKQANSIGGSSKDNIVTVIKTQDGGYISGGYFSSDIDLENGKTLTNKGKTDGMVIKYNSSGTPQWVKSIGGSDNDYITSIVETQNGDYVVGGYSQNKNAILIKYSSNGEVQWQKEIEGNVQIYAVAITKDNGLLVTGNYGSGSNGINLENNVKLEEAYNKGMIIKYNSDGKAEWAKTISQNTNSDYIYITSIKETQDEGYIIGGYTTSSNIYLGNDITISGNGNQQIIAKYNSVGEVQWAKSFSENCYYIYQEVQNYWMAGVRSIIETQEGDYVIGINCNEGNVSLGDISLNNEGSTTYHENMGLIVKYDCDGRVKWANKIDGSDSYGSEILSIQETQDKGYIVGGYSQSYRVNLGNSIWINKPVGLLNSDSTSGIIVKYNSEGQVEWGESINTESKINSIVETYDRNYIIGGYYKGILDLGNRQVFMNYGETDAMLIEVKEIKEIRKMAETGELIIENNTKQFEIKTSVEEFQGEKGGTISGDNVAVYEKVKYGDSNKSPIKITPNPDYKIIKITINGQNQRFEKSEDESYTMPQITNITEDKNIVVTFAKRDNTLTINKVDSDTQAPLAGAEFTLQQEGITTEDKSVFPVDMAQISQFYFAKQDGIYTSTNNLEYQQKNVMIGAPEEYIKNQISNSTANSFMVIDLSNKTGKYTLEVNAEISSEKDQDFGYATIMEKSKQNSVVTIPSYDNTDGRFMYISGTVKATNYTCNLEGGKFYHLYFGYRKNESGDEGLDKMTINSIKVIPEECTVTTNTEGKGFVQIPFGKYKITETKAPEGYLKSENPIDFEFTKEGEHEIKIENVDSSKVTVHHYIKNTKMQLAPDEIQKGKEGDQYTTEPKMNLQKYTLEKDDQGKYIVPSNASGRYAKNDIDVTYEYIQKDIPLTVHHYIDGTMDKVPLANGKQAEDVVQKGKEGETYQTSAIPENELSPEYELAKIPEESTGTYSGTEMSVTYYYKKVKRNVILTKHKQDGVTPLADAKFTIKKKTEDGSEASKEEKTYTTNSEGKIETTLDYGTYIVTEVQAPEGYVLPENPTTEISITKDIENKQINITNDTEKGTVIVHYYIQGTQQKVPLEDGNVAEDVEKVKEIGEMYATKEPDNVSKKYELVEIPSNASGLVQKGTTEVNYIYKQKDIPSFGDPHIEKTSEKESIKKADEKIPYTITYTAEIDKYKGNAEVTIVDKLSYEIDTTEGKSDLAGGEYDEENKTITWKEEIKGIDTYKKGKEQINIRKTIQVTYKNIDVHQAELSNKAIGNTYLVDIDTKPDPEETEEVLKIDILKDVEAKVVWVDTEAQKEKRPEKLIVQMKENEEVKASKEITITKEKNEDIITFENLPKYDQDGNLINYTANEVVLSGEEHKNDLKFYKKEIKGTTVTNTFARPEDKITIKVNKEWVDQNNLYNKRPDSLILQVKNAKTGEVVKNGEIQVETQNSYTFTQLYKYDQNGNEITYTADEVAIHENELSDYHKQVGELTDLTDEKINEEEGPNTVARKQITITNTINKVMGKILVQHVDKETNKIIKTVVKTGEIGDKFETSEENIEGYILIESPTKKDGIFTEEEQIITYYYEKISSGIIEKHIDINTKKLLYSKQHKGKIGETYKIEPKTFEGYDLVTKDKNGNSKLPTNAEGKISENIIEVEYYYSKKASVKVQYIYKLTGEKILQDIQINGHENDDYTTEEKEFKGYSLIAIPKNKKGKMEITQNPDGTYNTEILVQYYYNKQSKGVREQYIDERTNEIIKEEVHNGNVGNQYEIKPKNIQNYDIVEKDANGNSKLPKNNKGQMTDEEIIVKYYCKRKTQVEVQYLEKDTNNILLENEIINGYVGDQYNIERKDIPQYKFVEEIGNSKGTMTKEKIIIKYYFTRYTFNLKVDTWVSKVTENGVSLGGNTIENKNAIYKLDIKRNKITTADIKITYKIRITNSGEIKGNVDTLTDIIPDGYSYYPKDNAINWDYTEGILTTHDLKEQEIEAGENKEIELVLRWNKGEHNFGEKLNTVALTKIQNSLGYEDINKEDNISRANMIITIGTGIDKNSIVVITANIVIVLVTLLGIIVFYKRKA